MSLPALPVDAVLPELIDAARRSSAVVLRAPTGAGKTTRVPPALLDAGLPGSATIVMLEPRRLAAQTAARRMAFERHGRLGDEIGYQIRFDRAAGPRTRILAVTEGILLRMLQDDPFLERVGVVIFDEFHERNLQSDLALAMVRRVQRDARPDLKIVVMSATFNPTPIAEFLACPAIESEGRLHPVELRYLPHSVRGPIERPVAAGVERVLDQAGGDVLVFLPGVGEIRRTHAELQRVARERDLAVMELYADLPAEQQDAALRRADCRKIVLATNVAETSVTIEGVTAVVDSGLARVLRFEPAVGLNRLELTRVSRASADQRAGRAGRTEPGICLRLWDEREQRSLVDHEEPEVRRLDLAGPVLQLRAWGEPDVRRFPWFEPPPEHAIDQAEELLVRLGALSNRGITQLGRQMARLPVHPRLARLLVEGHARGWPERAALVAAILSQRDPLPRNADRRAATHSSDSDVLDRVQAIEDSEHSRQRHSAPGLLDPGAVHFILRARDQLLQLVREACGQAVRPAVSCDEAVLRSLLAAFPDRVARRREPGSRRALMVGGRGVRLFERSAVTKPELMVCVDVEEVGKSEALVRQASAIERGWLSSERLRRGVEVEFDAARERVVAVQRTRYDDLVIDEAATDADERLIAESLASEAAKRLSIESLFGDTSAAQFLARVRCLRQWMPELNLPALTESELWRLLPQICAGRRSFAELRDAPAIDYLKSSLTHAQLQALDREAPQRIAVPSGSRVALRYEVGHPPVLAVRIQQLFGLAASPRVARGRVPVLLHLLAPNMRPQQVTDDLASFWRNTYPIIRSELRRRYPKHAWPEDPTTAAPERRPGKKRSANS